MKNVLLELISSKKFLVAVSAVIVWIGGRFGLQIDTDTLDRIFAALLVYIGAQGIADNGKSAARIYQTPVSEPQAPPAEDVRVPPSVIVGAVAIALVLAGCGARARVANGIGALVDCEANSLRAGVAELVPMATQAIVGAISGDGRIVDTATFEAAGRALKGDLGRCAFAAAVAALVTSVPTSPDAPASAPMEVDSGALRAAFESVRASWGGASYRTGAGVL